MAISFVAASAAGTQSQLTTLTLLAPAGLAEGDVLVALGALTQGKVITAPSGWTLINSFDSGSGSCSLFYWYKVAGASEPGSYSFSINPSTNTGAITMMAFRGVDTAAPIRTSGDVSGGNATSIASPSLTGVQADDMVAIMAGCRPTASGAATITCPETGGWVSPAGASATSTDSFAANVDGSYKLGGTASQTVTISKSCGIGVAAIALAPGATTPPEEPPPLGSLLESSTSPAAVTSNLAPASLTTEAFTPPDGSLLVAMVGKGSNTGGAPVCSVADSTGGGDWAGFNNSNTASSFFGCTGVFYRYFATSPGAMTVTAAFTQANGTGELLAVKVVRGADPGTPVGAEAHVDFPNGTTALRGSLTLTRLGSLVYGAVSMDDEGSATVTPDASTETVELLVDTTDRFGVWALHSAAATDALTQTTYGGTAGATGGSMQLLEVVPAVLPVGELHAMAVAAQASGSATATMPATVQGAAQPASGTVAATLSQRVQVSATASAAAATALADVLEHAEVSVTAPAAAGTVAATATVAGTVHADAAPAASAGLTGDVRQGDSLVTLAPRATASLGVQASVLATASVAAATPSATVQGLLSATATVSATAPAATSSAQGASGVRPMHVVAPAATAHMAGETRIVTGLRVYHVVPESRVLEIPEDKPRERFEV